MSRRAARRAASSAASPPSATIALVAEFGHGRLEQPALHGIVIDYENRNCHDCFEDCADVRMIAVWIILAQGSK